MRHTSLCTGLLALAALALPGWLGAADDKPTSTQGSSASKKPADPPKERLTAVGQILGEITKVSDDGKSLTLRMHQKVPQLSVNNMGRPGGS
jgi:hypothetical protein